MRALVASLLFLPLVAGCIGDDSDEVAIEEVDLDDVLDLWAAGATAANMESISSWGEGGSAEIDLWDHLLFADRGNQLLVLDVGEPTTIDPVFHDSLGVTILDLKVSHDGKYLFVGDDAEGSNPASDTVNELVPDQQPFTGGFYVFDVSDPEDPERVSHLLTGPRRGPHMVYHANTSAGELVLGANADISINRFDRETEQLTELARYTPDILLDWNRDPEVFDVLYQGWAHDMIIHEDDQDGVLMYVANWDAGLRIVDLNDPENPEELGKWMDFPEGHEGNLHTVDTAWIGDRRITVGSTEVGFAVVGGVQYAKGEDRGILYVWDTTDPTDPTLLGYWENPDGPVGRDYVPDEEITSTHNLQLVDGRVYMAHYGLGVWVLDVSTPERQADPVALGYTLQEGQNTWDVVLHDGVAWSSGSLGIMGLHYVEDTIGDVNLRGKA